jgi:hypothetical protein
MADVIEIDCSTEPPTVIERDFTTEEEVQRIKDMQDAQAAADAQAEADAKAAKDRADAIAHAKSLGFTDAMIAVMYPGLAS